MVLPTRAGGLLSCNGTSNLLMDYKAEAPEEYWELIDTLFAGDHPLINHVKIEMGNDGNTSTASDPATIRYDGEEADASRSPGWQLAADARSVNPDVKISVLRWRSPNWTDGNTNTEKIYEWYRNTIFDAYEKYGVFADYIAAGVNEARANDVPVSARMAREFTDLIENESDFPDYMDEAARNAYHNTKFISADEIDSWAIVDEMYNTMNQEGGTYEAVDTVGVHYVTGTDKKTRELATKYNKEVWYSEACATIGLTHYVFQPAIGAFYDGLQYAHKDMVSAREPWAGYIRYDEALYMTAHFTRFSKAGWAADEENSNGIWLGIPQASDAYAGDNNTNEHLSNEAGAPSYMTLAAPDKSDFSVVAVNNSPKKLTYKIKAEDMNLAENAALEIWQTKANEYMEFKGEVTPNAAGYYVVTVDAGAIATFTTLNYHENEGDCALTLPEHTPLSEKAVLDTDDDGKMGENYAEVTDNKLLYADDFEYDEEGTVTVSTGNGPEQQDYLYSRGSEPRYMMDTHGAWVVEEDENGNQRLGQILDSKVSEWNNGDPETIVGDYRWMNYKASIDVQNDNGYALIGIRQQTGMNSTDSGYNLYVEGETWKLRKGGSVLLSGDLPERKGEYYNLALEGKGSIITAYVDGEIIGSYVDNDRPYLMGRVFLGSPWVQTYFDNLKIERIPGYIPYATAFYDDHDDEVQYSKDWTLKGPGGGADDWYRTTSYNEAAGNNTYVTFSGRGTGFALVGANSGGAKLDIYVDGDLKVEGYETNSSNRRYSTAAYGGLAMGDHTYKVIVKEGTITIDGVYIFGDTVPGGGSEALEALVNECEALQEDNYVADKWQEFQTALAKAKKVLEKADSAAQSEIDTAEAELRIAKDALLRLDQPVEVLAGSLPEHLATVTGKPVAKEALAAEVAVKLADGTEGTAKINWTNNTAKTFSKDYAGATLKGTVEGGKALKVAIPVEVVPKELVYFIDTFDPNPEGKTTPVYEAVHALMGDRLRNDAADQISDGSVWGFNKTGVNAKNGTDLNDKFSSGYYMGGGNPVIYYLPLDAGEYSLTVGANEWWEPHSMKASVLAGDVELATGELILNGNGARDTENLKFVLTEAATVTLKLDKISRNDPIVSWLAVARQPEALEITGIHVETLPDKTDYLVGEEQYTVSELDSSTPGTKEITVSASGKDGTVYKDTFEVRVSEEVIEYYTTKIIVTSKPNKLKYYVGEELDTAGMVVKAYQAASPSNATREIEVRDYATEYDFSKTGKADVEVTYTDADESGGRTEFKDTFTVTVAEEPVEDEYYTTGIRIDKKPEKTTYKVGEAFDPAGMKVMNLEKASPSNAVRETEIPLDELDYRYDFSTPGNKKVKVVYSGVGKNQEEKEFSKTAEVTVANEAPHGFYTDRIKITAMPDKMVYRMGDTFAPAGMVVMAYQVNHETGETVEEEIKDYKVSPGIFMIPGTVKVTVSYTSTDKNGDAKVFQDSMTVRVKNTISAGSDSDDGGSYTGKPAPRPSSIMDGGSWKQDGNSWQYVKPNGQTARNEWGKINGVWYFFKEDGKMAADQWILDGDIWYFVNASGAMQENGWVLYKDNWYYLGQGGAMYGSRWVEYNGAWYYLDADGAMAKDTVTPDGYRIDAQGRWIQ